MISKPMSYPKYLIFVVLLIGACSKINSPISEIPVEPIKNTHPGSGDIYVIGDSLAYGYKATIDNVKPANCLGDYFHDPVFNLSIPGKTSNEILGQVTQVEQKNPSLVFVSSAGNDVLRNISLPGSYPTATTLREMEQMFDRLLATDAVVVYLGLYPNQPQTERLPQVAQMALDKGVIVVNGMDGFWGNPLYMSNDNIHPNNYGYEIMCNRIRDAVKGYYP